jgi:ribonuclease PH
MQALRGAVLTETFPKSFVDVYVLVLQADAGELPAAVMAASLALAHAGVACRDLVAACTVVRPADRAHAAQAELTRAPAQAQVGDELVLDPLLSELAAARASATVTALPASGGATSVALRGLWEGAGAAEEAVETALDACAVLDQALRGALQAAAAPQAAAALAARTQKQA